MLNDIIEPFVIRWLVKERWGDGCLVIPIIELPVTADSLTPKDLMSLHHEVINVSAISCGK